jgi:serine/threonine protein phosphatase 1
MDFESRDMASGRTLVFGDVHGCDTALARVLDLAQVAPDDQLVFLGDLIDRGPQTRQVLERILDLQRSLPVTIIRGNHEEMFLDSLQQGGWTRTWLEHGGREMLQSYGETLEDIPSSHIELLRATLPWQETGREIFAHASPLSDEPIASQPGYALRWNRMEDDAPPHESGQLILCGHTPQKHRQPHTHPGWICLDTWIYDRSGCLSALDLSSGRLFQASQWEDWSQTSEIQLESLRP